MFYLETQLRAKMKSSLTRKERLAAVKLMKLAGINCLASLSIIEDMDTPTLARLILKGFLTTTKTQFMVTVPPLVSK